VWRSAGEERNTKGQGEERDYLEDLGKDGRMLLSALK